MSSDPHRYADPSHHLIRGSAVLYSGVLLGGVGVMQVLLGIGAVAKDTIYATGIDYVVRFGVTTWGWIHIIIGAVAVVVSLGLVTGRRWGILAGIGVAIVSALSSFLFLPHYPSGALVILGFDVLVLWALCAELGEAGDDGGVEVGGVEVGGPYKGGDGA